MTYNVNTIAERIKYLIDTSGYTLSQVAEKCEVQQYQTISSWKSGNSLPSLEKMLKLCELFNCELGYLLGEYEERTRPVTDIRAETGLSADAIEALQILNKYSKGNELRIISETIVFPVKDSIVKEFSNHGTNEVENIQGDTFFQALNNLIYQFKMLPLDELQKAGYMALFQRLFNDFIEEQLKKPLPIDI